LLNAIGDNDFDEVKKLTQDTQDLNANWKNQNEHILLMHAVIIVNENIIGLILSLTHIYFVLTNNIENGIQLCE
jgi:hypothetical protein